MIWTVIHQWDCYVVLSTAPKVIMYFLNDFAGNRCTTVLHPIFHFNIRAFKLTTMRIDFSYAGLHCVVIKGYSKSAGYQPGYRFEDIRFRNTWNAVYLDGSWRFVQCNWGARHLVYVLFSISILNFYCHILFLRMSR